MSDAVEVPYGDNAAETAQNLLAAAERLDLPPFVVATTTRGVFIVPAEVADEASAYVERDDNDEPEGDDEPQGKSIDDFDKAELDEFAEANDIDLTGHKKSNATKAARIKEVLAERATAKQAEADANAAADDSDTPPDSDSADAAGDEKQE